tara:strand:- start:4430 stop:5011 length:582 start_codon:yes stop_codon:yes gene_type:complete
MQAQSPRTRYLQSLGLLGDQYRTPAQRYQAGLFDPLQRLFDVRSRFGLETGSLVPEQEKFFGTTSARGFRDDPGSIYSGAQDVLGGLLGLGRGGRQEKGVGFMPTWGGDVGMMPADVTSEDAADLMRLALRGATSRGAANRFAQRIAGGVEQGLFERAVAGGGTAGTEAGELGFLNWLANKYDLKDLLGLTYT